MNRRTTREFGQLFQSYLTNIFLFAIAIFIYRTSRYYKDFLSPETQKALLVIVGIYIVVALPLELMLPRERRRLEGKGLVLVRTVIRFLRDGWKYLSRFPTDRSNPPTITKEEKNAILFLLVKFFFLPAMINFAFGNFGGLTYHWNRFSMMADNHALLLDAVFPFLMSMFLFVDTMYFIFGYSVEYPAARNTIRSVEPTLFGWMIALMCYPPFNGITSQYLAWSADSSSYLGALWATYAMRISAVIFLWIYLWATLALGPRCSNLTNRGIVTWGPYAYVRHPAYVGKILGWLVTSIPFFLVSGQFFLGVLSLSGWATIYFFRALTEERHLIADPDYQAYCEKVKWRFIPYVF